jgi:hypothetical protein
MTIHLDRKLQFPSNKDALSTFIEATSRFFLLYFSLMLLWMKEDLFGRKEDTKIEFQEQNSSKSIYLIWKHCWMLCSIWCLSPLLAPKVKSQMPINWSNTWRELSSSLNNSSSWFKTRTLDYSLKFFMCLCLKRLELSIFVCLCTENTLTTYLPKFNSDYSSVRKIWLT